MNTRMAALAAIVLEMQAINAKLAVIATAMDSTMGRTGRMLPSWLSRGTDTPWCNDGAGLQCSAVS